MKRRISKEGRKKIAEAAHRRWEKYRATKDHTEKLVAPRKRRKYKRRVKKERANSKQRATRLIAQLLRMLPDELLVKSVKVR